MTEIAVNELLEAAYRDGWEVYNEDHYNGIFRSWARKKVAGKYQYQRGEHAQLDWARYGLAVKLMPFVALPTPNGPVVVITPDPVLSAPSAPSGLSVTADSQTQLNLAWTDNANNEDGFRIEESPDGSTGWTEIAVIGQNSTSYQRTGLSAGQTRHYRLRAYNTAGNSSYSASASGTTDSESVPTAPSNLSVTPASSSQFNLSWQDNSNNETGFKIEESANGTSGWSQIDTVGAGVTTYQRTGLAASTTRYYRVRASGAAGDSAYSNTANGTTSGASIPSAPSGLTVQVISQSRLDLAWTSNSGGTELGFKVEESPDGSTEWTEIATVGVGVTAYARSGLNPSTTRHYRVRAYNGAGNSSYTNTASGTTSAAVSSPTGRNPLFLWTSTLQASFNTMVNTNHWAYQYAVNQYNTSPYGDQGQWGVILYQMTGNAAYAAGAIAKIEPYWDDVPNSLGRNFIRESYIDYCIWRDWLHPALTPAQRTSYDAMLVEWAEFCLGQHGTYIGGFDAGDSDQAVGQYFGLCLTDALLGTNYRNATTESNGLTVYEIGGLDANTAPAGSIRKHIQSFAQKAAGGIWVESSEYNLGTNTLWLSGVKSLQTYHGQDYFPEYTALIGDLRNAQHAEITPTISDSYQWGDTEGPHSLHHEHRLALLGFLNSPMIDTYRTAWPSATTYHRFFYGYDVNNPLSSPPSRQVIYGSGVGVLIVKNSTNLLGVMAPNRINVHHEVYHGREIQWWNDGEWVWPSPHSYAGPSFYYDGNNAMGLAGLSVMYSRGPTAQGSGADYAYIVFETGGQFYPPSSFNPPPSFLNRWRWTLVFLESENAVVVRDWVDMVDPAGLAGIENYAGYTLRTGDVTDAAASATSFLTNFGQWWGQPQAGWKLKRLDNGEEMTIQSYDGATGRVTLLSGFSGAPPNGTDLQATNHTGDYLSIITAPALQQWVQHMPVNPTVSGNDVSWVTAGGKAMRSRRILPAAGVTSVVHDEDTLYAGYSTIQDVEKEWQQRWLGPASITDWLNVVTKSPHPTITEIANGVQVGSKQVLFNASTGVPTVT